MHGLAQGARPLAVHDPHLEDPALAAGVEIIRHHVLHLARVERVQIQRAVDRQFDRIGFVGHAMASAGPVMAT
jgi:hypothetical protein